MTMQTDLFHNGAGNDRARSLPPHLDPKRVSVILIDEQDDRDHVAAPVNGVLPVGAVGNNKPVFVVRVMDGNNNVLHAESFPAYKTASNYSAFISARLAANRQRDLFAEDSAPGRPAVLPAGKASFEVNQHAAGGDLPLFGPSSANSD